MGHEISHKYTRSGSEMSHFIGLDREHLKRAVAEVLASDTKRKALNVARHPIEALKACFSVTETGPRLAEFESAYKELLEKWQSKEAATVGAVNAAAEVTINFRRSGRAGQVINQIIPFWNATVQGGSRFVRFAKQHPARAAFKGITALTIPTYILWDQNKDEEWYKKMPTWLKYGFWHIKVGDTIVRIPRPFEWSLPFSAMPEAALNQMYEENPGEVLRALRQQGGNMMPDLLPASIRPIIEVQANYDFFRDNYIVPPYTKKSPEDQYREWTTLTSREIGKLIGYSPEKIDHMIRGYTGGLGLDLIQAAEGIGKPSQIKEPADYPMVGRFFTRDYSKFQEEKKKTPSRPKTRRPERPETR